MQGRVEPPAPASHRPGPSIQPAQVVDLEGWPDSSGRTHGGERGRCRSGYWSRRGDARSSTSARPTTMPRWRRSQPRPDDDLPVGRPSSTRPGSDRGALRSPAGERRGGASARPPRHGWGRSHSIRPHRGPQQQRPGLELHEKLLTRPFAGGRYWDRTSDLFGVNYAKHGALTCGNATSAGQRGPVELASAPFRPVGRMSLLPSCSPTCSPDSKAQRRPRPRRSWPPHWPRPRPRPTPPRTTAPARTTYDLTHPVGSSHTFQHVRGPHSV